MFGCFSQFSFVIEKCSGPGDPGPCKNFVYKWRYDVATKECATFIWGGCDGNAQNRFNTEIECTYHCLGEPCKSKLYIILYKVCGLILILVCSDTLPTYLKTTTKDPLVTEIPTSTISQTMISQIPSDQPIPNELRGSELTFEESGHEKTFLFAQNNTFIQMDGDLIQTFQLR